MFATCYPLDCVGLINLSVPVVDEKIFLLLPGFPLQLLLVTCEEATEFTSASSFFFRTLCQVVDSVAAWTAGGGGGEHFNAFIEKRVSFSLSSALEESAKLRSTTASPSPARATTTSTGPGRLWFVETNVVPVNLERSSPLVDRYELGMGKNWIQ